METIPQRHAVLTDVAETLQELEAGRDQRDVTVVDGAILESRVAERFWRVEVLEHADQQDGPTREPALVEGFVRRLLDDQTSESGRVPEELVEAHRDEVRLDRAQIETAVAQVRGGVQQDGPAELLCPTYPLEGVDVAGVVALRREGEQLLAGGARVTQHVIESFLVDLLVRGYRGVAMDGAVALRILAEPVDAVVVVRRHQ